MTLDKVLIAPLLAQQESQHKELLHRISSLESQVSQILMSFMAPVLGGFPNPFAWQYCAPPESHSAWPDYVPISKHEIGTECGGDRNNYSRVFTEAFTQTEDCEIDRVIKHTPSLGQSTGLCSGNSSGLPDSKACAWVLLAKASLALQEIRRIEMWVRPNPVLLGPDGALPKVLQTLGDAHDSCPSAIRPSWEDVKSAAKVCRLVSAVASCGPLLPGAVQATKAASRLWRDFVVCQCIHHVSENGTDDKGAFLACLDQAFEGELQNDANLISQLLQAYSRVPKVMYRDYNKRRRQKKKKTASQEEPIQEVDHQHIDENIHDVAEVLVLDTGRKKLLVRNTFIDVMSDSSSCIAAFARSCPGNFVSSMDGGVAKLAASDCAMTVLTEMASDDETDDVDPRSNTQVLHQCAECRCEDPSGWEDPSGRFYCLCCWKRWKRTTSDSCSVSAAHLDDKATNDGLAEVYHQLDPICGAPKYDCKVILHEADCFDIAATTEDTCLVLMGSHTVIEPVSPSWTSVKPPKGILYRLYNTSTFQKDAVREHMMVPRMGGVYSPVVTIFKDSINGSKSGFQTSILYATCPWPAFEGENNGEARFRNEFRDTIHNALRVCYKHNHRKLLIGSRFSYLPKCTVAQLFREVLLEVGDTCNIFEQVDFAFCPNRCDDDVVSAFVNEFHAAPTCNHFVEPSIATVI